MDSGPIGWQLLLQAVLIAINAFFAAAEIAVISLNENKLRHQAGEGDKKAALMLKMMEQPSGFLSTIQVFITLAGFLGSAFAATNFSGNLVSLIYDEWGWRALGRETLSSVMVLLLTLILSYFTLVFGELVPKRVAMKRTEQVANLVCGPVNFLSKIAKPIVALLSLSTNGILRLMGIDPKQDEEQVTEDEIRMMVDIGEEKGTIEGAEKEMIENIFDFGTRTAADCMTHRVDMTAISTEDTADEIFSLIEKTGLSRFPVYGEDLDDVKGTVTARDLLINARRKQPLPLEKLLRPARFVPESAAADDLFRQMQKDKSHLAIVVDEYGGTSGLITMEDLLEEIVGNIYDEYDPQVAPDIEKAGDNLWRVAGSAQVEIINEALDAHIPVDEEYETLGGLVFSNLTSIPRDGATPEMDCDGLHIRVEKIEDRRVVSALVSKREKQDA